MSWSLIFRLLFAVAIAYPPALLPGSGREIEGVINSELRDLRPLTCGSVLSRLLLLPPHFLDISDRNVTTFSPRVAFLFVWTEPWPVVQFVGPFRNTKSVVAMRFFHCCHHYSWIICCVMCAFPNKSPRLSVSIWMRLNKEENSAVSSRGVGCKQSFLRLNPCVS